MLARLGPSGEPIETPSICLYGLPFEEKMVFVQESSISFFSVRFFSVVEILFLYTRFKIMLTVFLSGMLLKRDVTSKETNRYPSLKRLRGMLLMQVTASKLSFTVNLLVFIGLSSLVRYLATGWLAVPVVSIISLKESNESKVLQILGKPCARAGLVETGLMLSY